MCRPVHSFGHTSPVLVPVNERHTHTSEGVSRIPAAKPEKLVMRNRTARSHTHSAFECVREFLTVLSTCILYLNAVLWYSVSSRTFSVFFFRRIQYMMRKDWTQPLGIYFFFLSWVSLLICFGFSFFVWNWFCFFFFWPSGICSLFLFLLSCWLGGSERGIVEDWCFGEHCQNLTCALESPRHQTITKVKKGRRNTNV